ncbi:hypothetical protein H4R33_003479 [Dimargaris cristalligena]|uniref:Cytidine deaminase n=1 Tax=Dimargaris cristalligena TaxID=215637 RepID=A0A4P9ZYV8_9FUNG|nr:hypothetical protein H4R33_003479 [Dimargaris cristalligena]RKP38945.1 hypothetical protein BJ085DRAFT_19537 [Dimargaris cristalligena]|eukprot:RKP38945.1 hypothetical protein BJ085DRAFT_19537 [Dimargaris cristalligena]
MASETPLDLSRALAELPGQALTAQCLSYSPYSKFRVGAALLTTDGQVFTGCNVENASYGACICAERTAFVKAVSEGHTSFRALALATDLKDKFGTPCGICRQFMSEFGTDLTVILVKPSGDTRSYPLSDLLPIAFGPDDL